MSQPTGSIYEIRWHELCPWLVLAKALRVSLFVRVLLYAWLGLIVTQWGWSGLSGMLADENLNLLSPIAYPNLNVRSEFLSDHFEQHGSGPLIAGWTWLSSPVVHIFQLQKTPLQVFQLLLCGGWAIAVWGIFGGAIARTAARYLTREEIIGPLAAGRAALTKWPSTAGAPIIALVFAALMAIPLAIVGILMRVDLFAMVAGFLWIFLLVWSLLLAIVLVALWFGWPLMWATIAVERSDAFDAASRTAAYVYQRPLRLVFYVAIATLLGIFGQLVVSGFAAAGSHLAEWAVSWGAGNERIAQLAAEPIPGDSLPTLAGSAALAEQSIAFWNRMLATVAAAYPLAYLFSASVAIYLLLRLHVDSTEMDEIVVDAGEELGRTPELKVDGSGLPTVGDDEAEEMSTRRPNPPN